jgi:hypothetical protein
MQSHYLARSDFSIDGDQFDSDPLDLIFTRVCSYPRTPKRVTAGYVVRLVNYGSALRRCFSSAGRTDRTLSVWIEQTTATFDLRQMGDIGIG